MLHLAAGPLELRLVPWLGGSIASLDHLRDGQRSPVLRHCPGGPATVLDSASFPLVPYSNRIRDGLFVFRGREVAIRPNMPPDPSPLHGQGWLAEWKVERVNERDATLSYHHEPGEWPWAYRARQSFELDEKGLSIRLSCANASDTPMPCGLGQHPYFPCNSATRLDAAVVGAWTIDEATLPVARVPAAGRYDLRDRVICGQGLDHGFDGWSGIARITTPGAPFRIEMTSPTARCFQLYSPPSGGFFVAEPVTHVNAALNAPEDEWEWLGLKVLDPGEEAVLDCRIAIIAI